MDANSITEGSARFDELIQIADQVLKANNSGIHEIRVMESAFVKDGIGLLYLSKRDFQEFCKRQDPTKQSVGGN